MKAFDTDRGQLWALSARCVSCGSCEQACRKRHGVARLRRPRHGQPIVFPEVCRQCALPACVESCISGGLAKDADSGRLVFNDARCVACWSCILGCPHGAVRQDLRLRPLSVRCDRCIDYRDMACVSACPTGAMRTGDDETLKRDIHNADSVAAPLVTAGVCVALPAAGLVVGFVDPGGLHDYAHVLGIAAGVLMALSLLLPIVGRILAPLTGRALWVKVHVAAGVLAAMLAMMHAGGRFDLNAQSAAAVLVLVLVVTAVAYRYLRPLALMAEAVFLRRAAVGLPADNKQSADPGGEPLNVEAMGASVRQARAWCRFFYRAANVLALSRSIHLIIAILTAGLVLAHAIIMTLIGAD